VQPNTAQFRFYEELNDFLPPEKRKMLFDYTFNGNPSIKDAIEANGVPHTEVDLILVNGTSVDFSYHLAQGDRVSVYPVFEALDISNAMRLRDRPLREPKFVLDVHLGKLCRLLRLLGFDVLYRNDYHDKDIVAIATSQHRIILTRDRGLLKNKSVTHGYCPHSSDARGQLAEVMNRFDLYATIKPFTRCVMCNGSIGSVDKKDILGDLPLQVAQYYFEFSRCQQCGKIFWKGSHYSKMDKYIQNMIQQKKENL
jgi:uncharacterized protein